MEIAIDRRLGRDLFWFVLAESDFFEDPSTLPSNSSVYKDILDRLVPSEWRCGSGGIWLHALPPSLDLSPQGFKIHISGTSVNGEELLARVVPVCVDQEAGFKVIANPRILEQTTSKNYSRGASGKFITIYPNDHAHFVRLVKALDAETRGLAGPYILSDKPYQESKVVFYRYGGFVPRFQMNIYGERIPVISTSDDGLAPDDRTPFFQLPEGVMDPFESEAASDEEELCLNNRYSITDVMIHSNAGGVYKAQDRETGRTVIVKEARPLINVTQAGVPDAIATLRKEARVLEMLEHTGYAPRPVALFQEWEHYFLVEEFVSGIPLSNYRGRRDVILVQPSTADVDVSRFCRRLCCITRNLIQALQAFHRASVIVGDLSPQNILIDPESLAVKIIDFEGACIVGEDDADPGIYTLGFASPDRRLRSELSPSDDFYALGCVVYSLIFPVQEFFSLSPDARDAFIDEISRDYRLPPPIKDLIFALLDGEVHRAQAIIERMSLGIVLPPSVEVPPRDVSKIARAVDAISEYILGTIDAANEVRLWPSDYRLFSTNPLSVAYGAVGTALFLKTASGRVPLRVVDWIDRQRLSPESYAPGLFVGLSGIAWGLSELGLTRRAKTTMDMAFESPILSDAPDIFYGTAGVGLTGLYFFQKTGEERFLQQARNLGDSLIASASLSENGCYWTNADGVNYFGFCHGASGIALFLLYLYMHTGDEQYLSCATSALDYEISHGRIDDEYAAWDRAEGDSMEVPYWRFGSAGIGSVMIRFYSILGESRYLKLAEKTAHHAATKYALFPGQFLGLSGIGEFFIDLYNFTGQEKYLNDAFKVAEGVLLYQVKRPEGLAWPGEELLRICTDYGTGSAGIGMFLHRLLNPAGRWFYEFDTNAAANPFVIGTSNSVTAVIS